MCERPITVYQADGRATEVACRECWQCKENRINDWVGRNIAESKVSTSSNAITLTYGREDGLADHWRAAVLTYSDVQKYFKRLRFHGYDFSQFTAGEYGGLKGRSHWHTIIHWRGAAPFHNLNVREDHYRVNEHGEVLGQYWDRGYCHWKEASHHDVRYNTKYITKNDGDAQCKVTMSKSPPLGRLYFAQWAYVQAMQGLAPQDATYFWPDVRNKEGEVIKFMMKGVTLDHYLHAWKLAWDVLRPTQNYPNSEIVEEFLDPGAWKIVPPKNTVLGLTPWQIDQMKRAQEREQEIKTQQQKWVLLGDKYHEEIWDHYQKNDQFTKAPDDRWGD